jgi:Cu(I)/Ag(I) efflux system membrane protein CusA/SilA
MVVYQAVAAHTAKGELNDENHLQKAVVGGAALWVRSIAMTVAAILAGLLSIMWGNGTGAEIMRRIAAPMIGAMITVTLLTMFVIPAAYGLVRARSLPTRHA